jgi:predicted transcriptional regulator
MALVSESVGKASATILAEREPPSYEMNQQVQITVSSKLEERDLLKVIGDECARTILLSIMDEPKSAIDITRDNKIPISSVYRKLHWLENARLIKVKGFVITGDGKKYHLYQSRIRSIRISLPENEVKVELTNNNGRKHSPTEEQEIPVQ